MTNQNTRISRGLAAVIDSVLDGSHPTLDSLFLSSGASGPIPEGSHAHKWKDWIVTTGRDPSVNNFEFIGLLIEEFMDVAPLSSSDASGLFGIDISVDRQTQHDEKRKRLVDSLAADGLQYFHGGRIIPIGGTVEPVGKATDHTPPAVKPKSIDEVLVRIFKGLKRSMYPLTHRRKDLPTLAFDNEYDLQDLVHVLLRPWVKDIRPEEYTPSYAGRSSRQDFLLPDHFIVVETKIVRDVSHGKKIGQELIIDISHYRQHPKCKSLWCIIYDPNQYLANAEGLAADLSGNHKQDEFSVEVTALVFQ